MLKHSPWRQVGLAAILLTFGSITPAIAEDNWTGAAGAFWSNPANWLGNAVPVSGVTTQLRFDSVANQISTNDLAEGFTVNALRLSASGYNIGGNALVFDGDAPLIGLYANGTSTLAMDISLRQALAIEVSPALGNLVLTGKLSYNNALYPYPGVIKTGSGTLHIASTGSSIGDLLTVREGTIRLENGATLDSFNSRIGDTAGTQASVIVDGVGSYFANSNTYVDKGTLSITNGGRVNTFQGDIGNGSVTVSGRGSVWNQYSIDEAREGYLSVGSGSAGTGAILIANEGRVENTYALIGDNNSGSVTITDAGSVWTTRKDLYLGYGGKGEFTINNGAVVNVAGQTLFYNNLSSITVNAGTFSTATLVGTGNIIVNSGGMTLQQTADSTFDGNFTGTGNLLKTGAGVLTVTGNFAPKSTTIAQGGLLLPGGNYTSSEIRVQSGANLHLTNGTALNLGASGQVRASSGSNIEYDNATVLGGLFFGPGTQTITGDGATFIGSHFFNSARFDTNAPTNLIGVTNGGTINAISGAALTLGGFVNDSTGKVAIGNGVNVQASDFINNGQLTINAGGTFTNIGTTPLGFGGGSQTYIGSKTTPGGILDSGGQDIDLNGALLVNNGVVTGGGNLNIGYGSTVKGAGDFSGITLNIEDGGRFSPGNSPGLVNAGGMIWGAGGELLWEISDALGGAGTAHDFTYLTGSLTIAAGDTPNSQFVLSLASLLPGNTPGALANFDITQDYSWDIVTALGGISGFDPSDLYLDTAGFTSFNPGTSSTQFSLTQNGNALKLNFTGNMSVVPEASTGWLMLLGVAGVSAGLWCRSRR